MYPTYKLNKQSVETLIVGAGESQRQNFDGKTISVRAKDPLGSCHSFNCEPTIVDGVQSHAIKRLLLLGRKAMTKLDSVLKTRGISLLTTVYTVKDIVFPVVIYGYEHCTIKKAECPKLIFLNCGSREDS